MNKILLFLAICSLSPLSYASEVYKWKDANGVIHFGDQQNAPDKSEKILITPSTPGVSNALSKTQGASEPVAGNAPTGISSENVSKCAVLARSFIESSSASERKPYAAKIQELCPGTGFECTSVNHHREKDKCEPFILDGNKSSFIRDVKKDFPMNNRGQIIKD